MSPIPTFAYVLVSTDGNPLAESAFISSKLLRNLYATARIVLICDHATQINLVGSELPFDESNLEVMAVDVPRQLKGNAVRSRYLKSSIRSLLDGDLVFLDCDALPFRRFDELFDHDHSFAAVLDRNTEFVRPYMPEWVKPIYQHFEWQDRLADHFCRVSENRWSKRDVHK